MRVPGAARPVCVLDDSADLAGIWALGALIAFVVSAGGAGFLAYRLYQTVQVGWLSALIGLVGAIVAHQAVHALAMWAVRGRPRLIRAWRRLLPHVHLSSGARLNRRSAMTVMLAPLVVVDLVGLALILVPVTSGIGLTLVVVNSMGSVPDLWRAWRLARLPGWVECQLRGAALHLWTPAGHDRTTVRLEPRPRITVGPLVGVLGTWAFCLLAAEALTGGVVRAVGEWRGEVSLAGVRLASTEQFVSGPNVILNLAPVAVAGAALGTLAAAVWLMVAQVGPRSGRELEPVQTAPLRHPVGGLPPSQGSG